MDKQINPYMKRAQDLSYHWTLAQPICFQGPGLHTGLFSELELSPSETPGYWLWLNADWHKISPEMVRSTELCTRLGIAAVPTGEDGLQTVEHLLAALYGLGISALRIRSSGPEVPALDGSAQGFVTAILEAGIIALPSLRKFYRPQKALHWQAGEVDVHCAPAERLEIHYALDYLRPEYRLESERSFVWSPEAFLTEIASARTFAFGADLDHLWARGLARGGSLDNALVLEGSGYRNTPRFEDEPVRHKILDLLGDLALWEARIEARITIYKGGHQSHVKLVKMLQEQALERVSEDE